MIITIIILLLLVLLIKTANDGNTLSIVLLLILFGIGIIAVMISNPIISVIVVIIAGLYYILRPSKNTKNNTEAENQSDISENICFNNTDEIQPKKVPCYSEFQKELSQNTISPEEVAAQKWQEEQKQIIEQASQDYMSIKKRLLEKAQNGQYRVIGNKKCVEYSEINYYISTKINVEGGCNFSKRILSSQTVMHPWKRYSIQEQKQVDAYKQTIINLAHEDNIKVRFYYISQYIPSQQNTEVSLPIRYDSNRYEIKAYWECSVLY